MRSIRPLSVGFIALKKIFAPTARENCPSIMYERHEALARVYAAADVGVWKMQYPGHGGVVVWLALGARVYTRERCQARYGKAF
jgi:hypothetical protein